jgi:hypothetical protein
VRVFLVADTGIARAVGISMPLSKFVPMLLCCEASTAHKQRQDENIQMDLGTLQRKYSIEGANWVMMLFTSIRSWI